MSAAAATNPRSRATTRVVVPSFNKKGFRAGLTEQRLRPLRARQAGASTTELQAASSKGPDVSDSRKTAVPWRAMSSRFRFSFPRGL